MLQERLNRVHEQAVKEASRRKPLLEPSPVTSSSSVSTSQQQQSQDDNNQNISTTTTSLQKEDGDDKDEKDLDENKISSETCLASSE